MTSRLHNSAVFDVLRQFFHLLDITYRLTFKYKSMDFIDEIKEINQKINELTSKRNQIVTDHYDEIFNMVLHIMDWDKKDVKESSIQYSPFEKRIMIDIRLHKDPNARYVFYLNGRREVILRFREDFSKSF